MNPVTKPFRALLSWLVGSAMLAILLPLVLLHRWRRSPSDAGKPRLFWGTTPIVSMPMNARALRAAGYESRAVALANPGFAIPDAFDHVIRETASPHFWRRRGMGTLRALGCFARSLREYDIYHFFFTGGLLRKTPLRLVEPWLLRLARKKVIVFPYGSDAFAPSRIPYPKWREVLLADYPRLAREDRAIARRLDRFCRDADLVVGSLVHCVTLPRWDALMLTCYPVDTERLRPAYPDGADGRMRILHAPNHRAIKGTRALLEVVDKLRAEGLPIELEVMERRPHGEIIAAMRKADLVVDQLHFGYGLTAMEAMALGKMVISGANPPEHDRLFHDLGLKECPVIWSNPEDIETRLRDLCAHPEKWEAIGRAGRAYVEKYHSCAATAENWIALYERLGYQRLPNT